MVVFPQIRQIEVFDITNPNLRVAVPPQKNKQKQKESEKEVKEPSHLASCFRREIGTGKDFLVTLLETTVQPTAVFATAAKVYIAILDRLHFYSMT